MNFLLAIIVWLVMGAILGLGIYLLVTGSPWLFIIATLGFIIAIGKIGCASH